jgi:sugar lactone lactonase YvrE
LVEQLIRNEKVGGSIPLSGTNRLYPAMGFPSYPQGLSMNTSSKILTALAVSVLLTACPGSSGDSSSTTTTTTMYGLAVKPDGSVLYIANAGRSTIQTLDLGLIDNKPATLAGGDNVTGSTSGTGTAARFNAPFGLLLNGTTLYVADFYNDKIRKTLTDTKVVSDYPALQSFSRPMAIAQFGTNVYVVATGSHSISRIETANNDATIAPWAGTGTSGSTDGAKLAAKFNEPRGVAVDAAGNVYVSDSLNHVIRKIDVTTNQVSTIAGSVATDLTGSYVNSTTGANAKFNLPTTLVFSNVGTDAANGALYVTDTLNHAIRRISLDPTNYAVTTFAGFSGTAGAVITPTASSTDGVGNNARFSYPMGITIDNTGNLYVSDQGGTKVRKITAAGTVTTFTTTF